MEASNGHFVISLDFELFWGVFDSKPLKDYEENIRNVQFIIPRLLDLCDTYKVHLTFATVGFLFSKTKQELIENNPSLKPSYTELKYNPYPLLDTIGNDLKSDNLYFGANLIDQIKNKEQHEIGTHTYCHFYCLEDGQNETQFEADLKAAIHVAKKNDIALRSIVFPRNQINSDYLKICKANGITNYRGNEHSFFKRAQRKKDNQNPLYRILRLMDSYVNISGYNTYKINDFKKDDELLNIPSSRFLRPYSKSLKFLEPLKLARIKKAMSNAARKNELFHLWWHPHNFGSNIDENFAQLESIFKHYELLKLKYNFSSMTMSQLAEKNLA